MAGASTEVRREAAIQRALVRVTEAMDIIDAHGGPAEAAAYLELALQKLHEAANTKP